jgi:hypothetical protein
VTEVREQATPVCSRERPDGYRSAKDPAAISAIDATHAQRAH